MVLSGGPLVVSAPPPLPEMRLTRGGVIWWPSGGQCPPPPLPEMRLTRGGVIWWPSGGQGGRLSHLSAPSSRQLIETQLVELTRSERRMADSVYTLYCTSICLLRQNSDNKDVKTFSDCTVMFPHCAFQ